VPLLQSGGVERPQLEHCPGGQAPVRDLDRDVFYSDHAQSVVDPAKWQNVWQATASLRSFARLVTQLSDDYASDSRRGSGRAQCVMERLTEWADGGALLGKVGLWAHFDTLWFAQIAAGMAYLKVRDDPAVSRETGRRVERWLVEVARRAAAVEAGLRIRNRGEVNNLHYWTAAALAVAGVAADDGPLAQQGFDMAKAGLESVGRTGELPAEMKRGRRAFAYQVWALEALLLTVRLARANGVDLTMANDGALGRSVRFVTRMLKDPELVVGYAGEASETDFTHWPKFIDDLAFAEMFLGIADDKDWERLVASRRPVLNFRVGGNITLLFGRGK
jgi:poly(beta-D-mannuronate) lyase